MKESNINQQGATQMDLDTIAKISEIHTLLTNPDMGLMQNVKKINELNFDVKFKVTEAKLSSLFKGSSFTTETNKLYIYFENNKICGELGDKSRHNSDNFQCVLADTYEGAALTKTVPINFDTFRLINFNKCQDIEFAINIAFGVIKVTLSRDNTKLTYIVSALIN